MSKELNKSKRKTKNAVTKTNKSKKNIKMKKVEKKGFWQQDTLLKIVFFSLIIVVIVLSIMVYKKGKIEKNIKSDIVIPINETDKSFDFSINALNLSKTDEYVFKVTNYRKNKINDKKIYYDITINNDSEAVVEVMKNENNRDLMQNKKSTVITGEELKEGEKEDIYYHVKALPSKKLDKDDIIHVKITSSSENIE